ncbi:DcaP family trimeric outer membrane transporter [Pseudoxanthomonas sp.]|uniref:DcaP family trimeric outer membrane transporter n=1 Tax=Pseudoxanthomonas sp. TaxID=1871049 RepID=UPI00261128FF|nr:DcaP family trimeric outer membrane transporter [Pseudoxanthomonas sp.]WDS35072.1 MAG: DcaP family trimeric outer membrane transporter [Pseudoxanthomonas sp.]
MTTRLASMSRRPLAVAMVFALLVPGAALAQTKKEKELEARVAQLEAQVQALLNSSQQQASQITQTQGQVTQTQTQLDEVRTTVAKVPAGKQPIQAQSVMANSMPNTTFTFGGFIKMDGMYTETSDGRIADGSSGRLFYVPSATPVGGAGADGGDGYTDFHAQFSRFNFSADTVTENGDKIKAFIEADMFGGGSNAFAGNETATNTYALTLRHAYVSWNNWLAGQTWSNFMNADVLPDSVDFLGPVDGIAFVRQAQLRYTNGGFSVSLENPQTTMSAYQTGVRSNSGDNALPDITAKWQTKGDWGIFSVSGLLRQFKSLDEDATGGALSVAGKFNLGKTDDIRYQVNGGKGIGRYMALGLAPDTVVDANGGLHAENAYGGWVAWRHLFSPKLRTNLYYALAVLDNEVEYTGYGVTERSESWHANLIYSPFPKLDLGAELSWGRRELEDDRAGDIKRIQTSVKYSF